MGDPIHGVLRFSLMANFEVEAGTFQRSCAADQGDRLPLRNDISLLLQQFGSITRDSERMITMVDDHNISKPFEPIGIENFPWKDRSDLSSHRGFDFNPILPPLFKQTDHLSLNGRDLTFL